MSTITHTYRNTLGYFVWALVYSLILWFVPKPWNFDLGVILVAALFLIPEFALGSFTFSFVKKESGEWAWSSVQFLAWIAVIFSGLITFLATRAKAGVIDPLNFNVDWTLAFIFTASALVFIEVKLHEYFFPKEEDRSGDVTATVYVGEVQFVFLTVLLLGFEAYSIASILKFTSVPALLTNFPVPPFSLGLIYLVSAILKFILTLERK